MKRPIFLQSNQISIRNKVIIGFVVSLLGFIGLGLFGIVQQIRVQKEVDSILNEIQPVVFSSVEISEQIRVAYAALGFYLLSPNPDYKNVFEAGIENAREKILQLQENSSDHNFDRTRLLIGIISKDIARLESYKHSVYEIAESTEANMPGIKFANSLLIPEAENILERLTVLEKGQTESEVELTLHPDRILLIEDLKFHWYEVLLDLHGYLTNRKQGFLDNIAKGLSETRIRLDEYLEHKDKQVYFYGELAPFLGIQEQFEKDLEKLIDMHSGEMWRRDTHLIETKIAPLVKTISVNLDLLKADAVLLIDNANASITGTNLKSRIVIFLIILVGLICGVGMTVIFDRSISRRMTRLGNDLGKIAKEGNLNKKLDQSGRDEIAWFAYEINNFIKQIAGVVELVDQSSNELAVDATRTSDITTQVSSRVMRQRQEVDEVAVAISDMSMALDSISANTSAAAEAAKAAMDDANKGQNISTKSINSINGLADEVQNISESVERLATESKSIESILSVIKDISEQTNLLALNAAIEAARAGEYGRGFAVVADEVRSLSIRTAQETTNIQTLVDSLRAESERAVSALDHGLETAKDSVNISEEAGMLLSAISDEVAKITETITRIADSVMAQNNNSTLLTENINSISQIADETVSAVTKATTSTQELSLNAGQMRGMIEQSLMQDSPASGSDFGVIKAPGAGTGDIELGEEELDDILF